MYPLVESVRIENRQLHHPDLHNLRINLARKAVYKQYNPVNIESIVKIPGNLSYERYKCRLIFFRDKINYTINLYHQHEIKTLKVVTDNEIEYSYKSENRLQLDAAFAKRDNCDDIIIVKDGHITDSWAANLIFFNGVEWVTPDTPLLRGVQREYLLRKGKIRECEITIGNLVEYQKIALINAMVDFDRAPEIIVSEGVFF